MILYKILHSPLGLEAFDDKSDTLPTKQNLLQTLPFARKGDP